MPLRRIPHESQRAFTLLELVIVVMIIAILTAAAAPRVGRALSFARIDAACRRIKTDLGWARQTAITKSEDQSVQFTTATSTYSIAGHADLDRSTLPYSVALSGAPYRCTIASAVFGAGAIVTFDRFGKPSSGGTITVQAGGSSGSVIVDADTGLAAIL